MELKDHDYFQSRNQSCLGWDSGILYIKRYRVGELSLYVSIIDGFSVTLGLISIGFYTGFPEPGNKSNLY